MIGAEDEKEDVVAAADENDDDDSERMVLSMNRNDSVSTVIIPSAHFVADAKISRSCRSASPA